MVQYNLKLKQTELMKAINSLDKDELNLIIRAINICLIKGGKLIFCGNGGSAAEAAHLAAEFIGRFKKERNPIPALSLPLNMSTVTAIANDYSYDIIFEREIHGIIEQGDIVIGLSTSGNSRNVYRGLKIAKKHGVKTIAFLGKRGKITKVADLILHVDSNDTARIQEVHLFAGHLIAEIVEQSIYDYNKNPL